MRGLLVALWLAPGWSLAADEPAILSWGDLRPAVLPESNAFAQLTDSQLVALGEIVFARTLEAQGQDIGDAGRAKRDAQTAQLAREGLDVQALLRRRDKLITQRRESAETPTAALQGRVVKITGFLVPASADGRGVSDYLLVPQPGACSHTPPPAMNQIVRVRADALALPPPDAATRGNMPVTLTGTVAVRATEQVLFVGDGMVLIRSAYALDGASAAIAGFQSGLQLPAFEAVNNRR